MTGDCDCIFMPGGRGKTGRGDDGEARAKLAAILGLAEAVCGPGAGRGYCEGYED